MKIKFRVGLKFYITLAFGIIFYALSFFGILPIYPRVVLIVASVYVFVSLFEVRISNTAVFGALLALLGGAVSVFTGQFILECDIFKLNTVTLFANFVLCALLYFLLLTAFGTIKPALTLASVSFFILHLVNYALVLFRGQELRVSDFYSVGIAVTVAGNYTLTLSQNAILSLFALSFFIYFVLTLKIDDTRRRRAALRYTALGMSTLCALGVWWSVANSSNAIQNWGKNGTLVNGATYNLVVEMRESHIAPPEGYSPERVEEILSRYDKKTGDGVKPHIIVIMDEAFSDLSCLGEFETNIDPMPFFNSLKENTTRGTALSSVLGGNTATSEWEFLTGNTAAFLPAGAVAYQQYVKGHIWSIVEALEGEGYETVAMHPYNKSGWKRDTVYSVMGFDKMRFVDELTTDDKMRGFVTDRAFFSDIISEFESRESGDRLFMFNITMQNHGGYTWGGFENTVDVAGMDYYDVEQYLTLINHTDKALESLISYFEKVDEPVALLFFGDHQPALSKDFYTELFGEGALSFEQIQKKQQVPFIIWTNFDTAEEEGVLVGLNCLSSLLFEKAGLALPPYIAFLSDMRGDIPAMNAYGYYSPSLSRLARTAEATGREALWLEEYRILQYNNIFDKRHRAEAFE